MQFRSITCTVRSSRLQAVLAAQHSSDEFEMEGSGDDHNLHRAASGCATSAAPRQRYHHAGHDGRRRSASADNKEAARVDQMHQGRAAPATRMRCGPASGYSPGAGLVAAPPAWMSMNLPPWPTRAGRIVASAVRDNQVTDTHTSAMHAPHDSAALVATSSESVDAGEKGPLRVSNGTILLLRSTSD